MGTIMRLSLTGIAAAMVAALAICTARPATVTLTVTAPTVPHQIVNKASALVVAPQTDSVSSHSAER